MSIKSNLALCVSGNLESPHLDKDRNGINFVIKPNDAPLLPELFKYLKFITPPEITPVQKLENEEMMDIKALISLIKKKIGDDDGDGERIFKHIPTKDEEFTL